MGQEIAEGKGINLERTWDKEFLMNIRNHKYEYDELMAIIDEDKLKLDEAIKNSTIRESIDVDLVNNGEILAFEDTPYLERAEKIMQSKNIVVNIDMNLGDGEATAWGCDLTYDYVKINAEYTT
jgi:glutamate N-acetyltransferase/amino-acid N-acetyltransferase